MLVISCCLFHTPCRAWFCKNISQMKLKEVCKEPSISCPRKKMQSVFTSQCAYRPWLLWTGNGKFRYTEPKSILSLQVQNFVDFEVQWRVKLNILELSLSAAYFFSLLWTCWCAFIHQQLPHVSRGSCVLCAVRTWIYKIQQKDCAIVQGLMPTNTWFPCEILRCVFWL